MTSDSLYQLRRLPREYSSWVRDYRSQSQKINTTYIYGSAEYVSQIRKLHQSLKDRLEQMQTCREAAAANIVNNASARVAISPEVVADVRFYLYSRGVPFLDLAAMYAQDKNRPALEALRREVKALDMQNMLPAGQGERAISHAHAVIREHDSKLWDDATRRLQNELEESEISNGMMANNEETLKTLYPPSGTVDRSMLIDSICGKACLMTRAGKASLIQGQIRRKTATNN